jgi:hypothetical protein
MLGKILILDNLRHSDGLVLHVQEERGDHRSFSFPLRSD